MKRILVVFVGEQQQLFVVDYVREVFRRFARMFQRQLSDCFNGIHSFAPIGKDRVDKRAQEFFTVAGLVSKASSSQNPDFRLVVYWPQFGQSDASRLVLW